MCTFQKPVPYIICLKEYNYTNTEFHVRNRTLNNILAEAFGTRNNIGWLFNHRRQFNTLRTLCSTKLGKFALFVRNEQK